MAVDEYSSTVVRLFPDYAGTVLWFGIGAVEYEDAKLSPRLQLQLEKWERTFNKGQAATEYRWRNAADAQRFDVQGCRLAEQLADELGNEFEVEFIDSEDKKLRVRSEYQASNPEAAAAFREIARTEREFEEFIEATKLAGDTITLAVGNPGKVIASWGPRRKPNDQGR